MVHDYESWSVPDGSYVCELPCAATRLAVENDCVVAYLENGEKFVIPVECHESVLKN